MDKTLERIEECLGNKHGSIKELAEHLGFSPNVITNWKNGSSKSYRKYLKDIAEYYDVSEAWLRGVTDSPEKTTSLLSEDDDIVLQRILQCVGPKHGAIKELADALGVHPNVVTAWKNGSLRSYWKYLPEIADYFGVSESWLSGSPAPGAHFDSDDLKTKTYQRFQYLLYRHNATAYQVSKATGISDGSLSDWKNGRSMPKVEKLQKIADYFGVTVDYFVGNQNEKPAAQMDDELAEYLEQLKTRPEMRMLFSLTKSATKEDVERAVRIIEAALGK